MHEVVGAPVAELNTDSSWLCRVTWVDLANLDGTFGSLADVTALAAALLAPFRALPT